MAKRKQPSSNEGANLKRSRASNLYELESLYVEDLNSPIESLPLDAFTKILEHTPESALALSWTSRSLRHLVNEYAFQPSTMPLVEKLELSLKMKSKTLDMLTMTVRKCYSQLFELRLFRQPQTCLIEKEECSIGAQSIRFKVKPNARMNNASLLEYLGDCMGTVQLVETTDPDILIALSNLPKAIKFEILNINFDPLSDDSSEPLVRTINDHGVNQLTLAVRNVTISDPVKFLLDISSSVHSLRAYPGYGNTQIPHFGIADAKWAPLILQMFRRKLDKLVLAGLRSLSAADADVLREQIPLLGKKVWFESVCNAYDNGLNYAADDYVVLADPRCTTVMLPRCHQWMYSNPPQPAGPVWYEQVRQENTHCLFSIRHSSRAHEQSELNKFPSRTSNVSTVFGMPVHSSRSECFTTPLV